jgi:hypothetical protein
MYGWKGVNKSPKDYAPTTRVMSANWRKKGRSTFRLAKVEDLLGECAAEGVGGPRADGHYLMRGERTAHRRGHQDGGVFLGALGGKLLLLFLP